MNNRWQVYMLKCQDGSLYTGITTDIGRRIAQHVNGTGAKYLRGRTIVELVYLESNHTRSSATRRERAIKRLRAHDKDKLLTSQANEAHSYQIELIKEQ